ncbi:hypothetical protein V1517DRAFT_326888 [Lipomyces orientalis]|uniref:Uncharacterized protein n=1 Tax=Lipomyces orientalis TaxID=1233043 RepID=A0ACC3TJI5_9ASCO
MLKIGQALILSLVILLVSKLEPVSAWQHGTLCVTTALYQILSNGGYYRRLYGLEVYQLGAEHQILRPAEFTTTSAFDGSMSGKVTFIKGRPKCSIVGKWTATEQLYGPYKVTCSSNGISRTWTIDTVSDNPSTYVLPIQGGVIEYDAQQTMCGTY